jgi:hypothetical protein
VQVRIRGGEVVGFGFVGSWQVRILGNPKGCLPGWRIACDADLGGREVGAAFREFLAISLVCGFVRYWCEREREREVFCSQCKSGDVFAGDSF